MEGIEKNKEMIPKDEVAKILEEMRGDFKVFGEGLSGVRETVNLLAEDMDHVKSDIVDIKSEIKEVKNRLTGVEGETRGIKDELKEINKKLDNKAERTVVAGHEDRIIRLENKTLPKSA